MPSTSRFDAVQLVPLNLPYNTALNPLDDERAIVDGHNTYVTPGGVLRKRPGLKPVPDSSIDSNLRCDRLWAYETMGPEPKVYILGSFYHAQSSSWRMYYWRPDGQGWRPMPSLRDVNNSSRPHEVAISRGLAFIKSFPKPSSSERLGTIVFDGSATPPSAHLWGLFGPDGPMRISGLVTKLDSDIESDTTTITVSSDPGFPSPPFVVLIDYELIRVTGLSGNSLTVSRGYLNTPANPHRAGALVYYRDWNPSDHNVTVNSSWKYTYAYVTDLGHVSNRAPLEENPDKMPSETRYFFDQVPKLVISPPSDTQNIPKITVYRTTDGGGSFYYLETVTNTGSSPMYYYDDSLESGPSGGAFNDPVPDSLLDTLRRSPSLTSNSPPPTVLLPKVHGQDVPEASTRIVNYATRLWYAIGNVLFFSAQEELDEGIPEHAWPSGSFGNYFKLTEPITNLEVTTNSLWVFTPTTVYRLTGTNLETFSLRPYFRNVGAIQGHPGAVTAFRDRVAFVSQDFRVCAFSESSEPVTLSWPLSGLVQAHASAGHSLSLNYYSDRDKEWLVLSAHSPSSTQETRHYVLDLSRGLDRPFWFTPWLIRSTSVVVSRTSESPQAPRLVFALYDGSVTRLAELDDSSSTDVAPTGGSPIGFGYSFTTYAMMVPAGNHVNLLRRPAMYPKVQRALIENSGPVPVVEYYKDGLGQAPTQAQAESIEHVQSPAGYSSYAVPIDEVAYRLSLRISNRPQDASLGAEYYGITLIWYPEAGI